MSKLNKFVTLALLASILLMTTLSIANAQAQGTVVILSSVGGSTTPAAGTYNYADGSTQSFTAEPEVNFIFTEWVVSAAGVTTTATDNPLSLPMMAGVTYELQALFTPVEPVPGSTNLPTDIGNAAIIVVLSAAGGTTNPPAGTYALANAESLMLTATPQSDFTFSHWVISGDSTDHGGAPVNLQPTNNPYNVNHGYGYTYKYQPVFVPVGGQVPTPTGGASPTPTPIIGGLTTEWLIIIGLVVVIVIILIAFGVILSRRH